MSETHELPGQVPRLLARRKEVVRHLHPEHLLQCDRQCLQETWFGSVSSTAISSRTPRSRPRPPATHLRRSSGSGRVHVEGPETVEEDLVAEVPERILPAPEASPRGEAKAELQVVRRVRSQRDSVDTPCLRLVPRPHRILCLCRRTPRCRLRDPTTLGGSGVSVVSYAGRMNRDRHRPGRDLSLGRHDGAGVLDAPEESRGGVLGHGALGSEFGSGAESHVRRRVERGLKRRGTNKRTVFQKFSSRLPPPYPLGDA